MSDSKIKDFFSNITFRKAIWFAPLIYLMHMIEEAVLGFYVFMNVHHGTNVTLVGFLLANMMIMIMYLIVITTFTVYSKPITAFFALLGITAAQFFNAFAHLIYSIYFLDFCPGVITGFALYIPFVSILWWIAYKDEYVTKQSLAVIIVLGAVLMALFEVPFLNVVILFGWPILTLLSALIYHYRFEKSE
ncbi:MAG: HXXEE domain-containing protein [Candidatus Lokiarchaeota archaeon]|nr:HXXEE domain-containing protein [Candidatus Lokiarchaeota archaeon]